MRRRESSRWGPDKSELPFLHRMWVRLALGGMGLLVQAQEKLLRSGDGPLHRVSRPGLLKRLIYITGDSLNPVTRSFLEETRMPYLLKPVVASVLAAEVRRALACAAG